MYIFSVLNNKKMSDQLLVPDFMTRCKQNNAFSLPATYPEFVLKNIDEEAVTFVIKANNIDFHGAIVTVKHFIKFLCAIESCIQEELGTKFSVKVFHTLDYLERWDYNERKFIQDEFECLIKLDRTDQCFAVKVNWEEEDLLMTVNDLWNHISNLFYKKSNVLYTYNFFMQKLFPQYFFSVPIIKKGLIR